MRSLLVRVIGFGTGRANVLAALLGVALCAATSGAAVATSVSQAAWNIVSKISGVRIHAPSHAPANNFPDGPLIGNGSVGVAIQGRNTDHIAMYIGREDFWSVLRGRIMPVGRLSLSIPALHNGNYLTDENIGPADVVGNFTTNSGHDLQFKAWVAKPENLLVMQLHNSGQRPLVIRPKLLDAWGTAGAAGMAASSGRINYLRVSPDTVDARIGMPSGRDPAGPFHGVITNVRVLPKAVAAGMVGDVRAAAQAVPSGTRFAFLTRPVSRSDHSHGKSTHVDCGNLVMPQRAFTVSAWIYPRSAKGAQAIFSAMTSDTWQHWMQPGPNPPQISYGFTFSTVNGKLSAMLNRVRITAPDRLALNQWSHVAAIYNGMRLSLVVNGQSIAATNHFPTARQVVGPQWDWNAIHPGDKQIIFDGASPEGLLAFRLIGGGVQGGNNHVSLTLQPGADATILVSVLDNRDVADYRAASLKMLHALNESGVDKLWNRHLAWWKHFWGHSYIHIANKPIENFWYGSLYVFACSSAPGQIAPGLWGNFDTSPHMAWNGDYTLDYNYEAPYWAAYPTNHVALADNYDQALLDWMQRGHGLARHRHYHGLFFYAHLSPLPGWSADGAKSIRQKSDALFSCVDCLQRWRYTRSTTYARKVYPFLRGVAQFWDHYLVLKNGFYMDFNDAADELHSPHDVNSATSIAFLQMLYSGLLDINHSLHLNDPDAGQWRHILAHLSPLPIVPASSISSIVHAVGNAAVQGKFVIRDALIGSQWINLGQLLSAHPPVRDSGSSAGMNSHQVIFPGWAIGMESPKSELAAALNTVSFQKTWYDFNSTSSFYPACAAVGYNPDKILYHLDMFIGHFSYPNFLFQMGGGGTENFATVPTTICGMFLQSYQKNILVFPNWPKNQNASFGNLLACGDFLISSRLHKGRIAYVQIISRRDGMCHLVNPWPGQQVRVSRARHPEKTIAGKTLTLATRAGELLRLTADGH